MFTGIVERTGRVVAPGRRLVVDTGWTDLALGESVAVAGVCLTVARLTPGGSRFDLVPETLKKTKTNPAHTRQNRAHAKPRASTAGSRQPWRSRHRKRPTLGML